MKFSGSQAFGYLGAAQCKCKKFAKADFRRSGGIGIPLLPGILRAELTAAIQEAGRAMN